MEVVTVVPVIAAVLFPVELEITSKELMVNNPLYSATTADASTAVAKLIVIAVPAAETLDAYQISVVLPFVFVAEAAWVQVAPV